VQNVARVKQGTKWGFIDINGSIIIGAQFDELEDFYK